MIKGGVNLDRPLKDKVSITLDSNIVLEIRKLAAEDDRSFSQFINMVLRDYLNRREQQRLED